VIKLLEGRLSPGALVVADNTEMADAKSYLDYVRDSENGYVSVNFAARESDSMEIAATPAFSHRGRSDCSSQGVSHCTPSSVKCTPSLRTWMPSTLAV
jgi:hypothetical protein